MTSEQLGALVGLLLGGVIAVVIGYLVKQRKIIKPATLGFFWALIFALLAVTEFIRGIAFWAFYAWAACALTISSVLKFIGWKLNEKLVAGLMLLVIVVGGIPANAYVFSMYGGWHPEGGWLSKGWLPRTLSFLMLTLIVVPMLLGLIAYSIGKRSLSKKIIERLLSVSY